MADPIDVFAANPAAAAALGDEAVESAIQKQGEKCPTCAGTGQIDDAPCPDCGGTGRLLPDVPTGAAGRP